MFGAVFSRQGVRASLWLALLALLFTLAGAAIVLPWLLAMGFPANRVRPLTVTNPVLGIGSFAAVAVALFFLAAYAHTALIDLARRMRAGERADIEGALRGKERKTLSYAGALLLFSLIQIVAVAIFLKVAVQGFILGAGVPALGGPGAAPGSPAAPTRGPVVQASPAPFDLGTLGTSPVQITIPPGLIAALFLGLLLLVVWVSYFTVRLTFFRYAVAVDGERAVTSLKTSWRLTRGRWWPLFGTFLLLGLVLMILAVAVAFAVAIPFSLLAARSVIGILLFSLAFVVAFEVLWYLFGVPLLFYAGLVAYEEMKKVAGPAPAVVSAPPPPPVAPA